MGNSYHPSDQPVYGSYKHTLTADEMSEMYHKNWVTSSQANLHAITVPKVAGHLNIADGFAISIKTKPSEKHLINMLETFGWTWTDV